MTARTPGRAPRPRREIDWAALRRRIEDATRALAEAEESAPERVRAVLAARARELARPVAAPVEGGTVDVLTFTLGNEQMALELGAVMGVARIAELSLLPNGAEPLVALSEWRGELLPLLDLRRQLGLGATSLADATRVIVLGGRTSCYGIPVDAVHDRVTLPLAEIGAPPAGLSAARQFVRGLTRDALLVLDAGVLLRTLLPSTPPPEPAR